MEDRTNRNSTVQTDPRVQDSAVYKMGREDGLAGWGPRQMTELYLKGYVEGRRESS